MFTTLSLCLDIHVSPDTAITYRELFTYFIDITMFPNRQLFRILAEHASAPAERSQLLLLASRLGTPVLSKWRARAPTLVDILATFPSCRPPVSRLMQALARLPPRYYSIASLRANGGGASIVFNVSAFSDGFSRAMRGLATGWMSDLVAGGGGAAWTNAADPRPCIPVFRKMNGYFTRAPPGAGVLMVAAGTGVAPFIPFLEEMLDENAPAGGGGLVWLVYGARFLKHDFLFLEYLCSLLARHPRTRFRLDLCASRDEAGDVEAVREAERVRGLGGGVHKGYVHELCERESEAVRGVLLDAAETNPSGSRVFVCGSMRMSKSLDSAFAGIIDSAPESPGGGAAFLKGLKEQQRYIREIWG